MILLTTTITAADWPQMGGPLGCHASEDPALDAGWPDRRARIAWRVKLTNAGNPGQVAAAGGKVYFVDQNEAGDQAILRVLDLADGKELWTCAWTTPIGTATQSKRPFGMPAVTPELVYVIGPVDSGDQAPLRAIDQRTHQQAWIFDPTSAQAEVTPQASPCVAGDLVLISGKAGRDALIAVDRHSGKHLWTCVVPLIPGFNASLQNAPQVATLDGVRQIVIHHTSGVAGVGLDGKLLWNWDGYRRGTLTATPTVAPDGHIYVSSGHEGSSALFRVVREGGKWLCTTVFVDGTKGKGEVQGTGQDGKMPHLIYGNWNITSAAWWDGCFYAVGQKGLHCLKSDGSIAWTSGQKPPKLSPPVIAVNGCVLTYLGGKLVIARAGPERYEELATVPVGPRDCVSQIAYHAGCVVLRCDASGKTQGETGEVICLALDP
jgi:outer membrane protein assembly factor BamB